MSEWTVVTVIIALVGLFFTVGKPVINLNSNIVKLSFSVESLQKRMDEQRGDIEEHKQHARNVHAKLWEHNEEQDSKLMDHEKRISHLEGN